MAAFRVPGRVPGTGVLLFTEQRLAERLAELLRTEFRTAFVLHAACSRFRVRSLFSVA